MSHKKSNTKKLIGFPLGFFLMILGATLILMWWGDLVVLVKGSIGFILALAGLFILYAIGRES